jgi:hypothetical protein
MRKIILSLLLSSFPLCAAIYHPIDTTYPLRCSFSNKHHNRILVEEGRIKKVICQDDKLMIRVEELSGQVFVQAKYPYCDPTLISIVTLDGLVQDIEIAFMDCPSQVVILRNFIPEENIIEICESPACEAPSINESVNCVLRGGIPNGYTSVPFKNCISRPRLGVYSKLVGRLQGCLDTLLIYEITNRTCFKRKILEKQMMCPTAGWAYLPKHCLAPREKMIVIVAMQNE